jgi:hypothetical protein
MVAPGALLDGVESVGRVIVRDLAGGEFLIPFALVRPQKIPLDKKTKVATAADGRKVVKVRDAIECVEAYFNDGKLLGALASTIVQNFVKGTPVGVGESAIPQIADCIRKHALKQTKPERVKVGRHRTRKT